MHSTSLPMPSSPSLTADAANRAIEVTKLAVSAHALPVLAPDNLWHLLVTTVSGFRTAMSDWNYRPEAHYMRGPGPKCLRKNSKSRN